MGQNRIGPNDAEAGDLVYRRTVEFLRANLI